MYLIWSNEHNAWWRDNHMGYTNNIDDAGWYENEETLNILHKSACGSPPGQPKEVAVPYDGGPRFHIEISRDSKGEPVT